MRYYVYEDRLQRRARIHRGACGHCQEGQGKHGFGRETPNGRWHGPFPTFGAARHQALQLGHRRLGACRQCAPDRQD